MIIDLRCPKCDRPVSGRGGDDVVIRDRLPKNPPAACPHCQCPVELVESNDGIPDAYHYRPTQPIVWGVYTPGR